MAVLAQPAAEESFGLRPMNPMKDLSGVANLIEEAFANDLDRSGQNALQELRWLSRLKPVLWWMIHANPEHSDFLSGFVWEEDNRIVGNLTINRASPGSRRWLISNVAVAESCRRRGIARGLMYAGLELAHEYKGTVVSLQVRADNIGARRLYEEMNFIEMSGTTYLSADQTPVVEALPLPRSLVFRARRFDINDTRAAYGLACAATPLSVQKEWPIRQSQFRLGGDEHINNFFRRLWGGGAAAHWVVEDGTRFVGLVDVSVGAWGKQHTIELIVHPDWRGILEKPLISRALDYLRPWHRRSINLKHPAFHTEAVEAYKTFGLQEKQTLLWMKRDLQ